MASLLKEQQAIEWIEAVTGEQLTEGFGESLRRGTTLCRLAKTIDPTVKDKLLRKPYVKGISKFKEMENVTAFIKFCRQVGVPESDNFTTVALYELKDIGQVVNCIHSLGRTIQVNLPDFKGPHLGAKLATKNTRTFTLEQRLKAKGSTSKWTAGNASTNKNETSSSSTTTTTTTTTTAPPSIAPRVGPKPGSASKSQRPKFSKHDRKRSTEMNAFPCSNYRLDMAAAQFGNCKCGFSKAAHGLSSGTVQQRKDTPPTLDGTSAEQTITSRGIATTPCNDFALDMKASTFGQCICGHVRAKHHAKKAQTESQQALQSLGADRTALKKERQAKRAAKKAEKEAKAEPTQGWVTKRGQLMPTWKKRWFIYQDGILAYKTKKGGSIKGQLLIADCLVTVSENGLGFAVTVPGRTMRCKCGTKEEAAKWVAVLRGLKDPNNMPVTQGEEGESKDSGRGGGGGGGGGTKKKSTKATKSKIEFGDEEAEVLDEKSSTTLIKSTSVSGNVLKFEIAHRHPRDIYFTIDIVGSKNLKLKDSLANKRTQTVRGEGHLDICCVLCFV